MPQTEANNIRIAYETFGNPSDPPILLIMGLAGQLIAWDEAFCRQLSDSGLYVVTFDNRDVGLSTHFAEKGIPDVMDIVGKMMAGKDVRAPYSIEDMADDAVGLLDALRIEKAHICGMSMGGMIAQTVAIRNPERVLSLVSIYSTTGNPELPPPQPEVIQLLLTPPPDEREAFIEHELTVYRAIAGHGFPYDREWVRNLIEASYARANYPEGVIRQLTAIMTQKNRKTALGSVAVPTLVIHGTDDPLVPLECGKDTAEAVPGAELMIIEGMGHDLPHGKAWDRIGAAVIEHLQKSAAPSRAH